MHPSRDEYEMLLEPFDVEEVREIRGPRFWPVFVERFGELVVGFLLGFLTCATLVAGAVYAWTMP